MDSQAKLRQLIANCCNFLHYYCAQDHSFPPFQLLKIYINFLGNCKIIVNCLSKNKSICACFLVHNEARRQQCVQKAQGVSAQNFVITSSSFVIFRSAFHCCSSYYGWCWQSTTTVHSFLFLPVRFHSDTNADYNACRYLPGGHPTRF